MMGAYIDALPVSAKDRLIEAQEWCIAEVLGPGRARCLVGHAEDWRAVQEAGGGRSGWLESALAAARCGGVGAPIDEFSPELFAFRGAMPGDGDVYRTRITRWGLSSECRIGSRFDRLCARRGVAKAVALVKSRAAREFAPTSGVGYPADAVRRTRCTPVQRAPGSSVTGASTCAASTQSISRYSAAPMSGRRAAISAPGFQTTTSAKPSVETV